jgi:hypothetical protein
MSVKMKAKNLGFEGPQLNLEKALGKALSVQ